jgi:hypothetical protein
MIPDCITLRDDQKELLTKWVERINLIDPPSEYEEDTSMASDITFSIYSTGLGDNISVGLRGHWLSLTIDDAGELITPMDFVLDEYGDIVEEGD